MRYIQGTDLKVDTETAVALGKFDGMHLGHQDLLREMRVLRREGIRSVVFTFGVSPYALLKGAKKFLLMTNKEKEVYCEEAGVDLLVEYPFTDEVCHMAPEDFIRKVLVEELHARYVIVGSDFCFGYQRRGNVALLREYEKKYGYETRVLEKRTDGDGREISSTYVRERLLKGDMEEVSKLLGRPYEASGPIVHGRQLGRTFGLPTINLAPEEDKLLPPKGVYVSRVRLDNRVYGGVTNIGVKPTVSAEGTMGLETFLFDFEREVYGEIVRVELLSFIRPERKFASLAELEAEIRRNSRTAQDWLKEKFSH
ncbi:MAG: bifunctional riboflavin kinase/FAD synthetase [Lachnospiraceae bacterium]|nr:bifunctional riboflavin kinase/FAD synthetase [Lachnospiraceae bacterium]